MFNEGFFPTPFSVLQQMVEPLLYTKGVYDRYALARRSILEPSAGKGNIVDDLIKWHHINTDSIHCIELEVELQMILRGKGYSVIGTDFLTYSDQYVFDLIIMNPPFSDGTAHLLKAWDILDHGDIACLLNAETLRNPHTKERQLLARVIAEHGETREIGQAFKNSERATGVDVVIVWLHKARPADAFSFNPEALDHEFSPSLDSTSVNPLAHSDLLQSLVKSYEEAARLLREMAERRKAFEFHVKGVIDINSPIELPDQTLNTQISALKRGYWGYVFAKTKFGKLTTSDFQKRFHEMLNRAASLAFTEDNVLSILDMFMMNREQFMTDCIVQVFDKATAYHKDNAIHTEGWVTNKSWKIAPKIIMPYAVKVEKWGWNADYRQQSFMDDLDKVLCFLAGTNVADIVATYETIAVRVKDFGSVFTPAAIPYADPFFSTHFEIRVFKKGTVHLKFRDKDLLARFNIAAAQGKRWVGAG